MEYLLREYIREVLVEAKKRNGKSTTLRGQNQQDLAQALHWLKLHGKVKNAGRQGKTKSGQHTMQVKHKGTKNSLKQMIKDRFGTFIDVD